MKVHNVTPKMLGNCIRGLKTKIDANLYCLLIRRRYINPHRTLTGNL